MAYGSVVRSGLTALLGLAVAVGASAAQPKKEGEKPATRRVESLSPAVAKSLMSAYEELQAGKYREALVKLHELMQDRGGDMKPFDRASVLQIRGVTHINLDNDEAAMRDFEEALKLAALPPEQNSQLRLNVAQLYFRAENYPAAIQNLEKWLGETESPDANGYYLLAAAHYYVKQYDKARGDIINAVKVSDVPVQRHHDLANIIFAELKNDSVRQRLLARMIELWASEENYWKQLSGLYSEAGRQRDAFSVLEAAYRAGLVRDEADIVTLAQFYSVFENPYRGAVLLEREMEAREVKRTVEHLELLSQLWSQAREHAKAAEVLRQAAKLSDTGTLSYRLGQVLLAEEESKSAEQAFQAALDKGGLKELERADTWLLLGSARFNQAGPGDAAQRAEAKRAFDEAAKFDGTRVRAEQWRGYIAAIDETEARQKQLEKAQREALAEAARERLQTTCRARQITGAVLGSECKELIQEQQPGTAETEAK